MSKEIKTETDWIGREHHYIYEDGSRVGEIRQEVQSSLNPFDDDVKVDVVYDNSGNAVSRSTYETEVSLTGMSEETVYVTRDPDGDIVSETRHEARPSISPFSDYHDVTRDHQGNVIGKTIHDKTGSFIGGETHTYQTEDPHGNIHETRSRDRLGGAAAHLGTSKKTGEKSAPAQAAASDYDSYDNSYSDSGSDLQSRHTASYETTMRDGQSFSSLFLMELISSISKRGANDRTPGSGSNAFLIGTGLVMCLMIAKCSFEVVSYGVKGSQQLIEQYRKREEYSAIQDYDYGRQHRALVKTRRADSLRISSSDKLLSQVNELLERVKRENPANKPKESLDSLLSQELPDINHDTPIQEYERPESPLEDPLPIYQNTPRKTFDYTEMERPSHTPERRSTPRNQDGRRTYEVQTNEQMYSAIVSPPRSAPRGHIPIARKTVDADGNVSRSIEYISREEAEKIKTDEIGFTYISTGKRYVIGRERYPEFYRRLDRNGDGLVSSYENAKDQKKFSDATGEYPEGDIDSIVKEFMRKAEDKFGPFR